MKLKSNDRQHVHRYYVWRFNKTGNPTAEHFALWYFLLHLAFDTEDS